VNSLLTISNLQILKNT
jgi:hypothetical protein